MAQFKYLAVAQDGTKLKATTEAMSAEALRNELMSRQLEVKRISEKRGFNKIEITKQKVKRQEIMHFSRQIGAFVRAGIPIVDAIQTVREGTDNERFRDVLQDVGEQIQSGVPFSEALAPRRRLPELLHRDPALGGDHRAARRRARPALAVPRA